MLFVVLVDSEQGLRFTPRRKCLVDEDNSCKRMLIDCNDIRSKKLCTRRNKVGLHYHQRYVSGILSIIFYTIH